MEVFDHRRLIKWTGISQHGHFFLTFICIVFVLVLTILQDVTKAQDPIQKGKEDYKNNIESHEDIQIDHDLLNHNYNSW